MKRTMMMSAPLMLLLAGCGGGESAGNNSGDTKDIPPAAQQEQVDANLTIDPQNSMVPVSLPSPTTLRGLPPAFSGRWGMNANDCDPARADNKGLMTITGDKLAFYESRATASDVHATSPGRVTAALAFSGEGQTWRRSTSLTLIEGGRTLIREEQDPAASFRYSRCP